MARKQSLREFQEHLATRLSNAAQGQSAAGLLGVQAGNRLWLLNLSDSGEIIPSPHLSPVPLTKPWFAGIANIRGALYAVTDLSAYLGGDATPHNANARLLLVGVRHGSNAALLVNRSLGLKNLSSLTPGEADLSLPAWGQETYRDGEGQLWHKLKLRELLADPDFMQIGA